MFHSLEKEEVLKRLDTTEAGLEIIEIKPRQNQHGHNVLPTKAGINPLWLFIKQFRSLLIYILLSAAAISFFFDHAVDAYVILLVVFLNSVIGFLQEFKAQKAMEALSKLVVAQARVYRGGKLCLLQASELVPGDILEVEEGDRIAADCRLLETKNLAANEASLTGESLPVEKNTEVLGRETLLADQKNMLWMGTFVSSGRAKAVVTAIGSKTQLGKIAQSINKIEEVPSHFEQKASILAKQLGITAVISSLIIFGVGYFVRKEPLLEIFLFTIASLVSAIPEGLPAILAVTLAIGASRMSKRQAIIRRLSATETLGVVSTICTDKTGTLTQNTMTVKKFWLVGNGEFSVSGEGWSSEGEFFGEKEKSQEERKIEPLENPFLNGFLHICLLLSGAKVTEKIGGEVEILGDPTEAGLTVLAQKAGLKREELAEKVLDVLPFASENKFRAVLVKNWIYVVGAGEVLLEKSQKLYDQKEEINQKEKAEVLQKIANYSSQGQRTLGLAVKYVDSSVEKIELPDIQDLEFLGVVAISDPIRPEAPLAVAKAKQAGIRVMMMTGDHKDTAVAIGREIGLHSKCLTQLELEKMSEEEFERAVKRTQIFARLSPDMKLKITASLQKSGEIVAMTGDGVNDAPALKQADIGIAMGQKGTDVAREAAEIILANDNFASIISAVEEGRLVFENVRKTSYFLISTNLAETATLVLSMLFGLPLPLTTSQILWLNLVTDGLNGAAIALDPADKGILQSKPKKLNEGILNAQILPIMAVTVLTMAPLTLFAFFYFNQLGGLSQARTAAFMVMSLCQLFNIPNLRSLSASAFSSNLFKNPTLNISWLVSFCLIVFGSYLPFASWLGLVTLPFEQIFALVLASSSVFWIMEIYKLALRFWPTPQKRESKLVNLQTAKQNGGE